MDESWMEPYVKLQVVPLAMESRLFSCVYFVTCCIFLPLLCFLLFICKFLYVFFLISYLVKVFS